MIKEFYAFFDIGMGNISYRVWLQGVIPTVP